MNLRAGIVGVLALAAGAAAALGAGIDQGSSSRPLAFPGAVGFGALATGGRGGDIVHVTTLDDAGPGSFREAVSKPHRMVVFDVGGVVTLKSPLSLPSDLTIAGQSAPGEGITIYNNACSISGQSNIIIQYVRFRAGMASARGSKTLGINYSHNILLDHVTISWGRWDNTGMTAKAAPKASKAAGAGNAETAEEQEVPKALQAKGPDDRSHDITMQDCLVSEGLDPQRFGALLDEAMNITVCRTLWADNDSRNPKAKGTIQVINDVVYNWEDGGLVGGHSAAPWHQDFINNLFIAGPNSKERAALPMYTKTDNVYSAGNLIDVDRDGKFNPRPVKSDDFRGNGAGEAPTLVTEAYNHPPVPVQTMPAVEAFDYVLKHAGASLHRDAIDKRIIDQVASLGKKGAIIHDEKEVGGIAAVEAGPVHAAAADSDHDGIPDEWEKAHGLDPHSPADAAAMGTEGYTHLEAYLQSLVAAGPSAQ
jgi:hypothetical protein